MQTLRPIFSLLVLIPLGFVPGCGQTTPEAVNHETANHETANVGVKPTLLSSQDSGAAQDHGHNPGAHGGFIVSIGADSYHAEVVVEKSGTVRLLTLGRDESRIQEIEAQTLTAFVKAAGSMDAVQMRLVAQPQDGDSAGKTSQFVGNLPDSLAGQELEITIPNLRIGDERFRVGFSTAAPDVHEAGMPAGVAASAEEALYLTPAGAYTDADIAANGRVTASKKFKGIKSAHDMHPKPGDILCPITQTKANPKFTWIVGGKPYEFCCPPCVDEFVRMAKQEPATIKPPETYVK